VKEFIRSFEEPKEQQQQVQQPEELAGLDQGAWENFQADPVGHFAQSLKPHLKNDQFHPPQGRRVRSRRNSAGLELVQNKNLSAACASP